MKLKRKRDDEICYSSRFNPSGIAEIVIYYSDDADSDYIKDYDVWLEKSEIWKDLIQAFADHDIVIDNYNTCFFEPTNEEDKNRGFTL